MSSSEPPSPQSALASKKCLPAAANGEQKRPPKRRASKACQSCRSRKVRCNVVEHGAPCTNCRLDQIECVITESKRKRKSVSKLDAESIPELPEQPQFYGKDRRHPLPDAPNEWTSQQKNLNTTISPGAQGPNPFYQFHGQHSVPAAGLRRISTTSRGGNLLPNLSNAHRSWSTGGQPDRKRVRGPSHPSASILPDYIKPLTTKIGPEEATYLRKTGALSLPSTELRNEILRSFIEYVDPFMPTLELYEFLETIEDGDGRRGQISLLLFQAVMFAGSAFVDFHHLQRAGYANRRDARRTFFQRARLLYDFDYETDRISLVQALLLMTYWYNSPDDIKDTWHWMGVTISVAQSIGLHRNPVHSNLDAGKQSLWKRIWWSCVIRDRLIAIGMRRPMRIKTEEHDVPLPTLEDLELTASPAQMRSVPSNCPVATDPNLRRLLGSMFVEKAKFCSCISNVLSNYACAQQSLNEGGNARVTGTLIPKKDLDPSAISDCHDELSEWFHGLPEVARIPDSPHILAQGPPPLILHRALLHLIYYMTLSTLHRPYSKNDTTYSMSTGEALTPRGFVRHAAFRITDIMQGLLVPGYQRFLPTTGITVLQPALISHLLDIKSSEAQVRTDGLRGFCHCVQVLCTLRDCYAAADFALVMISAAVRKAQIDTSLWFSGNPPEYNILPNGGNIEVADGQSRKAQNIEDLVDAGIRNRLVTPANTLTTESPLPTPPSEDSDALPDDVVAKRLEMFLSPASIPSSSSDSEEQLSPTSATSDQAPSAMKPSAQYPPSDATSHFPVQTLMPTVTPRDLVGDFETPFNLNDMSDAGLYFGHGPGVMNGGFGGPPGLGIYAGGIQGESSGFWMDLDWIGGVPQQQPHHSHLPTRPHPHAP